MSWALNTQSYNGKLLLLVLLQTMILHYTHPQPQFDPYNSNCKLQHTDLDSKVVASPAIFNISIVDMIIESEQLGKVNITAKVNKFIKGNSNANSLQIGPFYINDEDRTLSPDSCIGIISPDNSAIVFVKPTLDPAVWISIFPPLVDANSIVENQIRQVTLKKAMSPKFWRMFENRTIKQGSEIEVECFVESFPNPSLNWEKNRRIITDNNSNNNKVFVEKRGSYLALKIRDADASLSGEYNCVASNVLGTTSSKFFLSVVSHDIKTIENVNSQTPTLIACDSQHSNYCLNSGQCFIFDQKPFCRCPSLYTGPRCQMDYIESGKTDEKNYRKLLECIDLPFFIFGVILLAISLIAVGIIALCYIICIRRFQKQLEQRINIGRGSINTSSAQRINKSVQHENIPSLDDPRREHISPEIGRNNIALTRSLPLHRDQRDGFDHFNFGNMPHLNSPQPRIHNTSNLSSPFPPRAHDPALIHAPPHLQRRQSQEEIRRSHESLLARIERDY